MAFEVPDLPYPYDSLEPHIDEETMHLHHDKHHQAYVDKLNAAVEGTDWADRPIEEIIVALGELPADIQGPVRNNGGGHLNHTLFWESMSPDGGGEPEGELGEAIVAAFGSFDEFKEAFEAAGVGQFGSGWAWLVLDGDSLAVVSTPNQDSPLTAGQTPLTCGSTPITCITRTVGRTTSRLFIRSSTGTPSSSGTWRPFALDGYHRRIPMPILQGS